MGIKKFDEFINESIEPKPNSVFEQIQEPFAEFILNMQERAKMVEETIQYRLNNINLAIERIMEEMADIIVGEPKIKVDIDLENVEVFFDTNILASDSKELKDENDPYFVIESKIEDAIGDLIKKNLRYLVRLKPNQDGNYYFSIESDMIDEDVFGNMAEAIQEFGK